MTIADRFARQLVLDHCGTPAFEVNLIDLYDSEEVKCALEALGCKVEIKGRHSLSVQCPEESLASVEGSKRL